MSDGAHHRSIVSRWARMRGDDFPFEWLDVQESAIAYLRTSHPGRSIDLVVTVREGANEGSIVEVKIENRRRYDGALDVTYRAAQAKSFQTKEDAWISGAKLAAMLARVVRCAERRAERNVVRSGASLVIEVRSDACIYVTRNRYGETGKITSTYPIQTAKELIDRHVDEMQTEIDKAERKG